MVLKNLFFFIRVFAIGVSTKSVFQIVTDRGVFLNLKSEIFCLHVIQFTDSA